MRNGYIDEEISVRPVGGMQLSEGSIREIGANRFVGNLPGIGPIVGGSFEDVRLRLEERAKTYYGDDVVVEPASQSVGHY